MPLTPNFSTTESLSFPEMVTFTDISTGSDITITNRRIYNILANGNYLNTSGESATPVYDDWSYSLTSIQLDLLTQSTTARTTVQWLAGTTVVYTKTILQEWDLFDYLFGLELLQAQTANPRIIQDSNYYNNFFQFITNIWNSENAVLKGDDLYSSQNALSVNQNLINNSDLYF